MRAHPEREQLNRIRKALWIASAFAMGVISIYLSSCSSVSVMSVPEFDITRIVPEPKANGYLLKIEASREVGKVAAWIGQGNWLYITIVDTSIDFKKLDDLKKSPLVRNTRIFRYESSVQVTLQLNGQFRDVQVLRYPGDNNIYIALYRENSGL